METTTPTEEVTTDEPTTTLDGAGQDVDVLPETFYGGLLTPDGKFADGWQDKIESFPEGSVVRENADFIKSKNFPDLDALMGSYVGLNQKLGKSTSSDYVKVLGEDAAPEDVAAFRKAVGAPEDSSGYDFAAPEDLPEGVTWPEESVAEVADILSKYNVPAGAAAELKAWQAKNLGAQVESMGQAHEAQMAEAIGELRKEWGSDYDGQLNKAKRMAIEAGIDVKSDPLANNPAFIKAMANMSKLVGEDSPVGESVAGMTTGRDRAEDIMSNPDNKLYTKYRQGDPEVQKLVHRLIDGTA